MRAIEMYFAAKSGRRATDERDSNAAGGSESGLGDEADSGAATAVTGLPGGQCDSGHDASTEILS